MESLLIKNTLILHKPDLFYHNIGLEHLCVEINSALLESQSVKYKEIISVGDCNIDPLASTGTRRLLALFWDACMKQIVPSESPPRVTRSSELTD